MASIRQLSPSVINKIAAGEVIERPASVVKELLENAVDAQARRIDVSVEQGGTTLIRVADDGSGIASDEMTLAVASHATSKIQTADDLFAVGTLGFRGEALASIAEVSQFLLRSRTAPAQAGCELEVRAGQQAVPAPCGCPVGTVVEVRNLFWNTPVRRKFLRTTQTEMGHVTEAFTRIALGNPQIHFTLAHNDRGVLDLPASERWRERIAAFFGEEVGESLIWVERIDQMASVRGYVADPTVSRSNNRMQYLFLNGRFIRDRSLQHALGEAYRGLLMTGRFPVAFLRLEMAPDCIDVNVHPTKLEVRFQQGNRLYSQLLGMLREKFLSSDLTTRVHSPSPPAAPGQPQGLDAAALDQHRQQLGAWARGGGESASEAEGPRPGRQERLPLRGSTPPPFRPFPEPLRGRAVALGQLDLSPTDTLEASPSPPTRDPVAAGAAAAWHETRRGEAPLSADDAPQLPGEGRRPLGLQVHNRYLITESDEGMVVIDQHALHERIIYEQLREKVLRGKLETQRLLVPEPVTLTAQESAEALEARPTLIQLGMEIEAFGGDTILILSYPAMLANLPPAEVLRQIIDRLLGADKAPDRRDVLDELLHMIACKAAVKAGDRLSVEEVQALLQQRDLYRDTHHCPHGRPTALVFSRDELDKRFKRT